MNKTVKDCGRNSAKELAGMFVQKLLPFSALMAAVMFPAESIAQHHHHGHAHFHPHHFGHHHHSFYVQPYHHHHAVFYSHQNHSYYVPAAPMVTTSEQAPPPQKPQVVEFGGFTHTEELANRLDLLANEFCLDLHYNYRDNAAFKEVYREAYSILQTAKVVHDKEHLGDKQKIRESLSQLDSQFHRVQENTRGWARTHQRQIGDLGIVEKAGQMESVIHHLLYDAGIEPDHAPNTTSPNSGREEAPPPE
ncbi:hypothetical protein K2X85_08550 [bacterium]|nr:hypothetical protein [bacterium]